MPGAAKRPMDEFLLSVAIFLVLPLLPLIMEFVLTVVFKSDSFRYLEKSSVMLTAPILTVGVALASRYKSIAVYSLIGAFCLAVLYGAQAMQAKPTDSAVLSATPSTGKVAPPRHASAPPPERSFWDKIGLDETPERVAWGAILLVSSILVIERAVRHIRRAEQLEFEWNK